MVKILDDMDAHTLFNLTRFYAQCSDEELVQNKSELGNYLLKFHPENLEDIKQVIGLINAELKKRAPP